MDKSEKDPAQAAEEARNGKPLTDQALETASGGVKYKEAQPRTYEKTSG